MSSACSAPALQLTGRQIDYEDERSVRLLLGRLIEPDDQLFATLREMTGLAELLRVIVEPHAPHSAWPEPLLARFEDRRAGLSLRLARADPEGDLAAAAAVDARYLIPGDEQWPRALDDLGGRAPFGLWIRGGWRTQAPTVSVVGARACTGYGNQAAGQLSADLARTGAVVVSGAALGVDGAAHRGALAVGGTTVAVLACGIDRSYPASHTALIEAIGQRGAVIAELPPGTSPTRFRFLSRNRLIAALGLGTVVVEAAARSGSLVTARLAAELGRAVFAVPGPVTSRLSTGTNLLLCDGAAPALDARQVLAELGVEPATGPAASSPPAAGPATVRAINSSAAPSTGPASDASTDPATDPPASPLPEPPAALAVHRAPPVELDARTMLVREALPTARSGRAADVLALAAETGLGPAAVLASLGLLAAHGQAVKTGSGWALR